MFGPSPCNGSGTTASADPCCLNLISQPELPLKKKAWQQVSPGKNADFPCALVQFTALVFGCIGLRCFMPTRPTSQPLIGFVFLKSQVCLRLPPDPTSQWRPCPWLMVAATNLHTGLSPARQRPCWAHIKRVCALKRKPFLF